MPLAWHQQMMKNGLRTLGYFLESRKMLYFVQQNGGDQPYLRLNVVKCATISGDVPGIEANFAQIVAQNATLPFL